MHWLWRLLAALFCWFTIMSVGNIQISYKTSWSIPLWFIAHILHYATLFLGVLAGLWVVVYGVYSLGAVLFSWLFAPYLRGATGRWWLCTHPYLITAAWVGANDAVLSIGDSGTWRDLVRPMYFLITVSAVEPLGGHGFQDGNSPNKVIAKLPQRFSLVLAEGDYYIMNTGNGKSHRLSFVCDEKRLVEALRWCMS